MCLYNSHDSNALRIRIVRYCAVYAHSYATCIQNNGYSAYQWIACLHECIYWQIIDQHVQTIAYAIILHFTLNHMHIQIWSHCTLCVRVSLSSRGRAIHTAYRNSPHYSSDAKPTHMSLHVIISTPMPNHILWYTMCMRIANTLHVSASIGLNAHASCTYWKHHTVSCGKWLLLSWMLCVYLLPICKQNYHE